MKFDLFGKDCNVLIEGVGGADIAACYAGLPRSTRRQLALLKNQREQWE